MEITTYYGMDRNPFIKDAAITTLFTSNDFNQMTNRLEFIIRSRGIGVFLSSIKVKIRLPKLLQISGYTLH